MANLSTETVRTTVSGTYQRRQGLQRLYTYTGAYGVNSEGTWWLVTVRWEGKLRGTPIGILPNGRSPTASRISQLIETQIEKLDQVAE
jgi:hypothetical protein